MELLHARHTRAPGTMKLSRFRICTTPKSVRSTPEKSIFIPSLSWLWSEWLSCSSYSMRFIELSFFDGLYAMRFFGCQVSSSSFNNTWRNSRQCQYGFLSFAGSRPNSSNKYDSEILLFFLYPRTLGWYTNVANRRYTVFATSLNQLHTWHRADPPLVYLSFWTQSLPRKARKPNVLLQLSISCELSS